MTWVSPDNWIENQIDHICVSSRFRRSLLDVRVKRGADVASDHHLLMGRCRLKLAEELQHRPKEDKLQVQHRDAEGGGDN